MDGQGGRQCVDSQFTLANLSHFIVISNLNVWTKVHYIFVFANLSIEPLDAGSEVLLAGFLGVVFTALGGEFAYDFGFRYPLAR